MNTGVPLVALCAAGVLLASGCMQEGAETASSGAAGSETMKTASAPSQGASLQESELATQRLPEGWVESTGTIANVTRLQDGKYAFTLTYRTAAGAEIPQHYLGKPRKPVDDQVLRVRYNGDEPIVYRLLDEIRYE